MRTTTYCFLSFAVLLLAATCLYCSSAKTGRVLADSEIARVNKAVAEFDSRMNQEQFGEIWDAMLPYVKGERQGYSKYLSGIHQQYGPISRSLPLRAVANQSLKEDGVLVIEMLVRNRG